MSKLWKKRQREIPSEAICRNCGAITTGRYCQACGQDIFAGQEQPIFQFVANLLSNAFSLDSKVLLTVRYLFFKPGFLSAEYRQGRIVRYVQPVKLFWMSTLIFFALLFTGTTATEHESAAQQQESSAQTTAQEGATAASLQIDINEEKASAPGMEESQKQKRGATISVRGKVQEVSREQLKNYLTAYAPYAAFFLIPIFALLLKLFFWRKKYFYLHHLTFAVHFHSFMWMLWSFPLIIDFLFPEWKFPDWLSMTLFFLPGLYLMIALYRFYQPPRKWSVLWKAVVISLCYLIFICIFLAAIILLLLLIMGYDL